MSGLLKSDIFFFITSVVVLFLGVLVTIIIFYLIRILSDVKNISKTVRTETEEIVGDISDLRGGVKERLFGFFKSSSKRKKGRGKNN